MTTFEEAAAAVGDLDGAAARAAAEHHDRLTKPRGSLGRVEGIGVRLAAIAGSSPPPLPTPAAVAVFAGDHGVLAEGVTPWPQDVTAQMVQNFIAGGAAVNVLARQAHASSWWTSGSPPSSTPPPVSNAARSAPAPATSHASRP
jgi:nicotinate-nucleotide--dimethylbenzimidazole phosphoribosyltransferase